MSPPPAAASTVDAAYLPAAAQPRPAPAAPRPWWREPYVWLVLAGPIAVILACIATAVVVLRAPDPLVDVDYYRKGLEINKRLAQQTGQATYLPAHQARNHAATGGVPPAPLHARESGDAAPRRPDQP